MASLLSSDTAAALKKSLLLRESGGDYTQVNQYGMLGGYQFSAIALTDIGLVKPNTTQDGLNDPSNWNNGLSKQQFLSNPTLQDQAYDKYSAKTEQYLKNYGVIDSNSSPQVVAGYIGAAHLGIDKALAFAGKSKNTNDRIQRDANGTTNQEYFSIGVDAANGKVYSGQKNITPGITAGSTNNTSPIAGIVSNAVFKGDASFIPKIGPKQVLNVIVGQDPADVLTDAVEKINPLEKFTTFNSIFTLCALTDEELNFPDENYKTGKYKNIILRSGGGQPADRITTEYGKFDFYIDDVEIDTYISYEKRSRGSNATKITFTVYEPYSLGLFLQSLQIAALDTGNKNYTDCPYLLVCQFIGYDSENNPVVVDKSVRHFPLKLMQVTMEVNAGGCKYKVEAYPHNEYALTDINKRYCNSR
jgi:hypothetical protein